MLTAGPCVTNQPPKGDRSDLFYKKIYVLIFILSSRFMENHITLYGNWTRKKNGNLYNIFEYHFGFKTTLKDPFLDIKTDFWMFQMHILDLNVHNLLPHNLSLAFYVHIEV